MCFRGAEINLHVKCCGFLVLHWWTDYPDELTLKCWWTDFPDELTLKCWWTDFCEELKPVLNWANVCSPEHTSDTSTNYDSFLN